MSHHALRAINVTLLLGLLLIPSAMMVTAQSTKNTQERTNPSLNARSETPLELQKKNIQSQINRAQRYLVHLSGKIQSTSGLSEQDTLELLATISEHELSLENLEATLQAAESNEEIQAVSTELRALWASLRPKHNEIKQNFSTTRIRSVLAKLQSITEKLQTKLVETPNEEASESLAIAQTSLNETERLLDTNQVETERLLQQLTTIKRQLHNTIKLLSNETE